MDKIIVGFNVLPLESGHKFRGMGYYAQNLLDNLKKRPDIEVKEFRDINDIEGVDLVHYPFFDLFYKTLPLKKKFPTVVTIGDVIPLVFSKHFPPGIRGKINHHIQKLALRNVKAVVTFSKVSANDISKYLGVSPSKIHPVYLAAPDNFRKITDSKKLESIKKKYNLPDKFALFVGSTNWNKNLINIAKACIAAKVNLVLVGKSFEQKDNLNHVELRSYKEFLNDFGKNSKIHILGFIGDEEIVSIYNLASVTMLPSIYEGFGLPILESQACGIPVITSNTSSMPEIAGKGAKLVNPDSVGSIVDAIQKVDELKEKLIKAGLENVKRFSWEKTADETIAVYKHVVTTNTRS